MPATPSDATLERSVKEFLADRFKSLAIEDGSAALYQQAAKLRKALALVNVLAGAACVAGFLALLITSFAVAEAWSTRKTGAEILAYSALLLFCMTLVVTCLRAGKIIRYRTWITKKRLFDIPDSETFSHIFSPVLDGTFVVAVISDTGSGSSITPVLKRPIAYYLGRSLLQDRALPAVLLQSESMQQWPSRLLKTPPSEVVILRQTPLAAADATAPADPADSILPLAPSDSDKRAKKSASKPDAHWLSTIDEVDYQMRSRRVANRYDGTRQRQVQTMLDIAYAEFNRDPYLTVAHVRKTVCKGLKAAILPIGAGKADAYEWIERMLARSGDEHSYSLIRRAMTEPDFEFPNDKRSQPELEFPPN
ncbi:hypothetical protein [Sandarakinorhabdus limnophila]|uniref:hypothetical protein n=1 Tax=Sandarakinorhabdus limnophila TaxID=210512 RepID=UPI0026F161A7|nr:hypothetical protein [Sandarakinorhabdus limnophila]MCM0033952.1 hypothetical protein [Sandarakinorhabdus limnophila]